MTFNPQKPYNDLPPLPPKIEFETKAVLKKAIRASRALAELKGRGDTIPNQTILINSLVLQEAKDSSEVENVITTNDRLFRAFSAQKGPQDSATKEVLHYRQALWEGYKDLKQKRVLATRQFLKVVQTIKENKEGIRKYPGTKLTVDGTNKIIFTPPAGEAIIKHKLKDLEKFIRAKDGIDSLVKLALVHYQFEAIHPFPDGNGRTGRILNILFLVYKELLDYPVLYLSKYIIRNKAKYYQLLQGVTEKKEWEPWILYMLDGVEQSAIFTRDKIVQIKVLMDETLEFAKKRLPDKVYSKELIELLFQQLYTKVKFLVEADIARRQTASVYLKELEKIGTLKSQKIGREILYLNVKLFKLLA
jgi:Fic family protein